MIGGYAVNRTRGVDRVVPDGFRDNTGSVSILYGGFFAVGRFRRRLHTASRYFADGHAGAAEDVHGWVDVSTNNLQLWSRGGRL